MVDFIALIHVGFHGDITAIESNLFCLYKRSIMWRTKERKEKKYSGIVRELCLIREIPEYCADIYIESSRMVLYIFTLC